MIPVTTTFETRQASLARRPQAELLIKDYAYINGKNNDDDTNNIIGGSAKVALATKITPSRDMKISGLELFMKSDNLTNESITVAVQTASAGKPSNTTITNGNCKILNFNDQAIGWRKARIKSAFDLSSGVDYYITARTNGSAYNYIWSEDESLSGGEWWQDNGSNGSWDASATDKAFIFKMTERNVASAGIITSIMSSGASSIIYASAESWAGDQWAGRMAIISSASVSGDEDSVGMSFYVASSTGTSLEIDFDPVVRGVSAGDTFYFENTNNYVSMDELISFNYDKQRDQTISIGNASLYNDNGLFFENQPRHSNIKEGNDVIIKIGFSGAENIQKFKGNIFDSSVIDKTAEITFQDVMGKFQRVLFNIDGLSGASYEDVVKRICQRVDTPFITDPTEQTVASTISFQDGTEALTVLNKVRESLSWRLYGDNYGRVRFREKQNAGVSEFTISKDDFILKDGFNFNKTAKKTINVLGATNVEESLTFGDEVLIASQTGSATATDLSVSFTSANVYSNIRWKDSVNDGSVYIVEKGLNRNTGRIAGGQGSLQFDIDSLNVGDGFPYTFPIVLGGSLDYQIDIYGTPVTLSGTNFYVEKTDGEGQANSGTNTTKLIVQNRLFKNTAISEQFLDSVIIQKGKNKGRPILNCRGIANIEIEDSINISHDAVDSKNIYVVEGESSQYQSGSFQTTFNLEDSLIRTGDKKYDIGLRYDQGLLYD